MSCVVVVVFVVVVVVVVVVCVWLWLCAVVAVVELEGTHIPHGQLFQLPIIPREMACEQGIASEKHKTSLFLFSSESA